MPLDYDFLANKLREVDQREDVTVTIFQGESTAMCCLMANGR